MKMSSSCVEYMLLKAASRANACGHHLLFLANSCKYYGMIKQSQRRCQRMPSCTLMQSSYGSMKVADALSKAILKNAAQYGLLG